MSSLIYYDQNTRFIYKTSIKDSLKIILALIVVNVAFYIFFYMLIFFSPRNLEVFGNFILVLIMGLITNFLLFLFLIFNEEIVIDFINSQIKNRKFLFFILIYKKEVRSFKSFQSIDVDTDKNSQLHRIFLIPHDKKTKKFTIIINFKEAEKINLDKFLYDLRELL